MTLKELESKLPSIGALARRSLTRVTGVMNEILERPHAREDKMSYWQGILSQSKANGGYYHGDELPRTNWVWPKNTSFQERLTHHPKDIGFALHQVSN